jgi:hypothetical protein
VNLHIGYHTGCGPWENVVATGASIDRDESPIFRITMGEALKRLRHSTNRKENHPAIVR